jgi:hypothetical protein
MPVRIAAPDGRLVAPQFEDAFTDHSGTPLALAASG